MELKSYLYEDLIHEENIDFENHKNLVDEYKRTQKLCSILSTIIEELPDTIYVTDGNARTMLVNKAFEEISGFDRKEIIGLHMKKMLNRHIKISSTLMALKTKNPAEVNVFFEKSGNAAFIHSKPVVDESGNIAMVLSNSRHFSEIRNLEEKLLKAENQMERYKSEIYAMQKMINSHHELIAVDKKSIDTLYKAQKVAKVDSTILLLGETGSGKEEYAKFIHANSSRADEKFVCINCGALTSTLIESELFGYERGSFTGADKNGKMGIFEVTTGGTVFLDEIGEMSLDMQVKLLRVLQEQKVTRIGSNKVIDVDVRIIAATNKDLKAMVSTNTFREDLYYRLNVIPITIPPLRERKMDIIPLLNHFLKFFVKKYGFPKKFSNLAYQTLKEYSWPGNVRELKNLVEQSVIMSEKDSISLDDLPISNLSESVIDDEDKVMNLKELIEKIEYEYIIRAYKKHSTVRSAAESLGMNYTTFERKRLSYSKKFI